VSNRDAWTDSSRDGSGQLTKKNLSLDTDVWKPTTVDEQNDLGGWSRQDIPTGASPANPLKLRGGMRGASDEGK
jgi:hypothetical protein